MTIEFHTLMSYADGELDPAGAREVEAAMSRDPEIRRLVAKLRESAAQVRAAFNGPAHEPVPAPLVAAIESAPRTVSGAAAGRGRLVRLAAVAAVACLFVGAGGGFVAARYQVAQELAERAAVWQIAGDLMRSNLTDALERAQNGQSHDWTSADGAIKGSVVPTFTFVDQTGRFCREYEQQLTVVDQAAERGFGVACRTGDDRWEVDYRLVLGPEQSMAL